MKQRRAFLETVRKQLLKKREGITEQVAVHSEEEIDNRQVKDVGDEALTISIEKLENSLQLSEIDEIRLINDALARIKRDEYGICVDCGEHILDKRLEFSPYSARCIACQEAFEE
ncbi:TraR/DksA C4-type zinc finger protein [Candidatus Babeliales bacterium]|nr:TraR/DksA C4-type zinc finger protein [Candidatus Babeliales bacterium]